MKRLASQNKRVGVLLMAFRTRKVFGTFEKLAPDPVVFRADKMVISASFDRNNICIYVRGVSEDMESELVYVFLRESGI